MPYAVILYFPNQESNTGKLMVKETLEEMKELKKWAKSKGYIVSKVAKTPAGWK